jgi:hypothetical protein
MRSFRIGAKCEIAVNTNMMVSPTRALPTDVVTIATPITPSNRQTSKEPKRTRIIAGRAIAVLEKWKLVCAPGL